jgi:hypothetical protein
MRMLLLIMSLVSIGASAADKTVYVKGELNETISKGQALMTLIRTENKETIYKCVLVVADVEEAKIKTK